jgi:hypothetical protein
MASDVNRAKQYSMTLLLRLVPCIALVLLVAAGCATASRGQSAPAEMEENYAIIVKLENRIGWLQRDMAREYDKDRWIELLSLDALLRDELRMFDRTDLALVRVSEEEAIGWVEKHGVSARCIQFLAGVIGEEKLASLISDGRVRLSSYWEAYPDGGERLERLPVLGRAIAGSRLGVGSE